MGMIIRLEPFSTHLETLLVFCVRFSTQPMPLILMQEYLEWRDAPASLALFAKFTHISQCGFRSDEQYTLTNGGTSCHLDYFTIFSFAFPLFFLHGTSGLFLDHPFDIVVVRLQFGSAEVRVYPLFVVGRKFGHNIDFGHPDVSYILGSPSVVCLARCDVARLDMYA
ncbi:hypothetical protein E5342_12935 [Parabacteroides distasonis]|uniref:Uncharacterized protein n=1 Tax=Parabacteroides distasonis TaxID=823 RepID=A0A4S2EP01_PARDI|nr:hypothetical protein E5342_12935 [Parabacteroides distasonis]